LDKGKRLESKKKKKEKKKENQKKRGKKTKKTKKIKGAVSRKLDCQGTEAVCI
jgi:hypothetical protein